MNLEIIKKVGLKAAYNGAKITSSLLGRIPGINKKGAIDLLTEADTGSERAIINTIRESFPDHSILAEESGIISLNPEYEWIIDPLDGTTNFAHGLNHYAISIAFAVNRKIVLGIVLNPQTNELFTATVGKGATLNGKMISVSPVESVSDSLLVTGFPYNFKEIFDSVLCRFSNCLKAAEGVRRFGSAALDLCYIACGRFDGFWEQNLKPWDTAAGFLIAEEAGAVISDFSNLPYKPEKKEILATNGKIHNQMMSLLKVKVNI